MAKRVCAEKGCPKLIDGPGRCAVHRREQETLRGSRQARGYDAEHDQRRRLWSGKVATGCVKCARCCLPIEPGTPWDLGHDDHDRTRYSGPEHEACNRATAGRR